MKSRILSKAGFFGGLAALLLCLPLAGCFKSKDQDKTAAAGAEYAVPAPGPQALALHRSLLTIDSHVDIPKDFATPEADPGHATKMQVDLPKMKAGGLSAGFFIVYVAQSARTPENYLKAQQAAMVKFAAIHRMCEALYPGEIGLALSAEQVRQLHGQGKLAALIGIENGFVIGHDLGLLKKYYDLGARYMTLAHMGHNDIADSANPRPELGDKPVEHNGLSPFGGQVIAEMNRLGMMVDVSHISKAAGMQAIALSRAPVIASHSAIAALDPNPRNMDDEELHALAKSGGVVQVVAFSAYLKAQPEKDQALQDMKKKMLVKYGVENLDDLTREQSKEFEGAAAQLDKIWPRATLADFVDHIDYAVKLIGIDHVGISSDFGGGGGVRGWDNAAETANVTAELLRRGYSEAAIAKLWGGNLLRVMDLVEQKAREIQGEAGNSRHR